MSHNTQQKRRSTSWITTRVVTVAILVGGIAFAAGAASRNTAPNTVPDNVVQSLKQTSQAFTAIEKVTSPAVVSIRVEKKVDNGGMSQLQSGGDSSPFNDEFFRRFFGDEFKQFQTPRGTPHKAPKSQGRVVTGQGSGYIVTSDGNVITNHHVIEGADKVIVRLRDEREFEAKIVGSDSHTDVAVLHFNATDLPTLQFGDSEHLQVGEWVLASGAPFGLTHTLTAGIVSAIGRSSVGIADYENFIQTDAAINPGNSGGPLLNLNGQVVGMNTAIFSKSGGYMGVGFAIPINMVRQVYEQILDHGSVKRAYLGVVIQPLTRELAESFGVKDTHGALIGDVQKGSPGELAGLKQGDIVTAINGHSHDDIGRFRNAIALMSPGTKVELTVLRDGKTLTLTATLKELPNDEQLAASDTASGDAGAIGDWGFSAQTLTPDLAKQLKLDAESGVVISEVEEGSVAARAGLQPGMLVRQVNRKSVNDLKELQAVLEQNKDSESLLLLLQDERGSRFVILRNEK
ncbi:MAG: DegQ family serine endoprotease [Rhodopirellula sp.]|nr:DegQ family serine endoprotease [Rhodopirellula sp.]